MLIFRIFVHALPIVPLLFGKIYICIAVLILVALLYIKTMKFHRRLEEIERHLGVNSESYRDIKKIRSRWMKLTFLRLK